MAWSISSVTVDYMSHVDVIDSFAMWIRSVGCCMQSWYKHAIWYLIYLAVI